MSTQRDKIEQNRAFFLSELRSGKYKKGTIVSDKFGIPVLTGEGDEGYCACALMHDLFYENSHKDYLKALGLTPVQCRYIQQDINDTSLTFPEIADRIEKEVFNGRQNSSV